eukprot:s176_g16.t1
MAIVLTCRSPGRVANTAVALRMYTAEQLLADAASYQQAFAKRSADELPQAWDAFNRYISEVVGKKQTLNISNFCRLGWKVEEGLHQAQMRPHFNISEVFARSCRADPRSQIQAPVQSLTFMEEFNFSKCALRFSDGLTKDRLFIWNIRTFRLALLTHLADASNLPQPAGLPWSERAAGALWGLFVGDALAMPVHWYYGGPDQIRTDFGHLLTGYERSVHPFPDSIMQLSNTGGGGRGSDEGDVVGGVILHDKKPYWRRGGQFHYHQTLDAGENTLEAVLAREVIRSLTNTGGRFSAEDFRQRYIDLMTTPGSHNDTYASTCHRMFFKKWRSGVAPEKCPDNDGHNVDTMDGLVLPSVVALAALVHGESLQDAAKQGSEALAVTRSSRVLPQYVQIMTQFLSQLLHNAPLENAAQQIAEEAYGSNLSEAVDRRGEADPVVACYIGGSFPALLGFVPEDPDVQIQLVLCNAVDLPQPAQLLKSAYCGHEAENSNLTLLVKHQQPTAYGTVAPRSFARIWPSWHPEAILLMPLQSFMARSSVTASRVKRF